MSNSLSTTEIWKDIKDYSNKYQISNHGRIRKGLKVMYTWKNQSGYSQVSITVKKIRYVPTIHKLVTEAFIGEKPDHLVVDHVDGNPSNNNLSNLEYVTQRENTIRGCASMRNMGKSSKFPGVVKNKTAIKKPWECQIYINGKNIKLGSFRTEIEAAKVYSRMWVKVG